MELREGEITSSGNPIPRKAIWKSCVLALLGTDLSEKKGHMESLTWRDKGGRWDKDDFGATLSRAVNAWQWTIIWSFEETKYQNYALQRLVW